MNNGNHPFNPRPLAQWCIFTYLLAFEKLLEPKLYLKKNPNNKHNVFVFLYTYVKFCEDLNQIASDYIECQGEEGRENLTCSV